MKDVLDIINNIKQIYHSKTSFYILKEFERVLDDLNLYVYSNWEDGELVEGPIIKRHWVTCSFMWKYENMPDPIGGERMLDYGCKVTYQKTNLVKPRKIEKPDDIRPGSKKGKLDKEPIWIVSIQMPRNLLDELDIDALNQEEDESNDNEFNTKKPKENTQSQPQQPFPATPGGAAGGAAGTPGAGFEAAAGI